MNSAQAHAWLDSITGRGWKLQLDRIDHALALLDRPQDSWRAVHVAGTNGKGSTCAFVEGILLAAGLRCGRFTSPHLVAVEERVRLDGADLSPAALAALLTEVRQVCDEAELGVTYFEAITAAGFLAFARAGVPLAAVEVGLGGRLDATRTCRPAVTVVTSIGLDHTRLLGDTPAAIAAEKAGIFRQGVTIVTACQDEALEVIRRRAEDVDAGAVLVLGEDFGPAQLPDDCGLPGPHQEANAACAIAACEVVAGQALDEPISQAQIRSGLSRARIRGRLERIELADCQAELWVDCAHNVDGARALCAAVHSLRPGRRVHLVYGCLSDKQPADVLAALPCDSLTAVTVEAGSRTRRAQELLPFARARRSDAQAHEGPIPTAVTAALRGAGPGDLVLVCGSVYLAGEVLAAADGGEIWPLA